MTAPVKLTIELTGELAEDMREIALRAERHVKVQARILLIEAIHQAKGEPIVTVSEGPSAGQAAPR